jgi:hypothetical protein
LDPKVGLPSPVARSILNVGGMMIVPKVPFKKQAFLDKKLIVSDETALEAWR